MEGNHQWRVMYGEEMERKPSMGVMNGKEMEGNHQWRVMYRKEMERKPSMRVMYGKEMERKPSMAGDVWKGDGKETIKGG
jgi:hypothetical protein